MPEVLPNQIELEDFWGGFSPDPKEAALPPNALTESLNLIPDLGSGAIELRPGFSRISSGRASTLAGTHWARHINYYELIDSGTRKRYLMCVMTDGTNAAANNVQIWAYDLTNSSFSRVDTAGRSWTKGRTEHFAAVVEGTYYGGTYGEEIYSWHPTNGWDADPTAPNVKTWVSTTGNSVDTDTEFSKNYAFKKGQTVYRAANDKYYKTARGIRYDTWEVDEKYKKGQRVSRKVNHGTETYWRSFEATASHTATTTNRPGDGSGGDPGTEWKNVKLKNILDEDSEITSDWFLQPIPTSTAVGAYHGNRLFIRQQDSDNWARLQYSAPAKPERDADLADLTWNPTDWGAIDDNDGDGGGWMEIPFSGKGDAIRALLSYGNYLLIFGRWQTYVLAGTNEQSWTLRKLGDYGALVQGAVTEHEGLVYFLSTTGNIVVTDGTSMKVVEENHKIWEYVRDRVGDVRNDGEATLNWFPGLHKHKKFLYVSLPHATDSTAHVTLVYHPESGSFWLTSLSVLDMTTGEYQGRQDMWFTTPITGASTETPTIFRFSDNPGAVVYTDDDWKALTGSASTTAISWALRTAWLQWGKMHKERRIRRLWALVKGAASSTAQVDMLRNFEEDDFTTVTRTLVGRDQGEFIEGKVGQTTSAYALGVELSGSASAEFAVYGIGVDTETLRTRFHK